MESAHKTIESSIMFIDGELKDNSEVLESLFKKKKPKTNSKSVQQELPKSMNVSLFVPFVSKQYFVTVNWMVISCMIDFICYANILNSYYFFC